MSAPTNTKGPVDDDLDDLDDYLDDFQDEILSRPYEEVKQESAENASSMQTEPFHTEKDSSASAPQQPTSTTSTSAAQPGPELSEDQVLESLLQSIGDESPATKAQFEALLKDLTTVDPQVATSSSAPAKPAVGKDANLKDTISSTLNRLKESGAKVDQSIQDEHVPGQDMLADLLAQLNMDGEDGDGGDIPKFLADLLSSLATKGVIYEPLKDLDAKYPIWLKEHGEKTPKADYERYTKQAEIVASLVKKFEEPTYNDDNEADKAFVAQKLEEMQESGDPPKELMGDMAKTGIPGFGFGSDDLPQDLGGDLEKDLEEGCKQQ